MSGTTQKVEQAVQGAIDKVKADEVAKIANGGGSSPATSDNELALPSEDDTQARDADGSSEDSSDFEIPSLEETLKPANSEAGDGEKERKTIVGSDGASALKALSAGLEEDDDDEFVDLVQAPTSRLLIEHTHTPRTPIHGEHL